MAVRTKPVPAKNRICVWTFPEGSTPAVRVSVDDRKIRADDLLHISGNALGVLECNLQFFGLFKGIEHPIRKYGNNEMIYLPCNDIISFQRWSFDITREKKLLKTDAGALHVLAVQCKDDIKKGRIKPKPHDVPLLQEYLDPAFPCEKQFIEHCQNLYGYASVHIPKCVVQSDLSVKDLKLSEGSNILVIANPRGLIYKTEKLVFFAPWRKIRRWSQVQGNSIHFEIFFTDEMRFEWVEVETDQAPFLMAVIAEFVFLVKRETEDPKPRPLCNWKPKPKLTWNLIKNELFSSEKKTDSEEEEEKEEALKGFDNLHDEVSDDESSEEEGAAAPRTSNRKRGYVL
ncbi:uncharacterized protein LOC116604582 [Nematostella vectensis]|uniref:uncharacterized protein LOC116604582 n=1 Tax=Nematostella vectensis TaxID=45351 RepID=UPI0020777789|nr:uncharacterized protein LOC116604582 [Nematostella vectensis]XP_048589287.1 uncharacterized protein LOC116604582 [Nematostella vectensis]